MALFRLAAFILPGAFGFLSVGLVCAAADSSAVSVASEPATIQRRTFDPKHPPPDMPKLAPTETALCAFKFVCGVEIGAEIHDSAQGDSPLVVSSLGFSLDLTVTVWLPSVKYPPKILAHEEAHRKICEHYYALAETAARQVGEKRIGTVLSVSAKDQIALRKALEDQQKQLVDAYLRRTSDRCLFAQDRFDELTKHGLGKLPEDDGIVQAIAYEEAASDEAIPKTHREFPPQSSLMIR